MSNPDPHLKPLRIQVAEALGFTTRDNSTYGCARACVGSVEDGGSFPTVGRTHDHIRWEVSDPQDEDDDSWKRCPEYDHPSPNGWFYTGPLILRFHIQLLTFHASDLGRGAGGAGVLDGCGPGNPILYIATLHDHHGYAEDRADPNPLIAVCRLIVALHEAGELPEVSRD